MKITNDQLIKLGYKETGNFAFPFRKYIKIETSGILCKYSIYSLNNAAVDNDFCIKLLRGTILHIEPNSIEELKLFEQLLIHGALFLDDDKITTFLKSIFKLKKNR